MTFFSLARWARPVRSAGSLWSAGGSRKAEASRSGSSAMPSAGSKSSRSASAVRAGLLATAALGPLLDDRRLVRLVAGVVVLDLATDDERAAERLDAGAYPLGDLVQRDADHDQQTEAEQQDQQRYGHVRGEQVGQQAGRQVAGDATGLAQRGRVVGPRQAVGDVDQSEQTEGDGCPADELATARAVALGMPQRPPGHQEEEQRCRVRESADQGGDTDVDRVAHGAGQTEPELGGDDDGAADQEQTHPVPPQGRIEVTGAGADGAGRRADQVSQAEPEGDQSPTDPGQQGRPVLLAARPGGAGAGGAGAGRTRLRRTRARGRRPGRCLLGRSSAPAARARTRPTPRGAGACGRTGLGLASGRPRRRTSTRGGAGFGSRPRWGRHAGRHGR